MQQPEGRWALVNGRIVLPDRILEHHAVLIEGPIIEAIVPRAEVGDEWTTVDVEQRLVTPGLVDIHVHGAHGRTFNEPSTEAWNTIARALAAHGITSACATIATAAVSDLVACLDFTHRYMNQLRDSARIVGAHLEGPYFSMEQRGAQDPQYIRYPDDSSVEMLLEHHGVLRMVSLAPELPGALVLIKRLRSLGVVAAAGHSSATDRQVEHAMAAGLRHAIHLWSGQSTTRREKAWRIPGLLEATLASPTLTGEIIADNKHLPPTLMRLAYRCLGPDRLCLVSDATSGAGLLEGSRFRMGGMEYVVEDGVGMMLDRTAFAGSTTLLNQMIRIMRDVVGIPLTEAVRMASLTPARVIGIEDRAGSIAAGKQADLVCFDEDFNAYRTLIGGQWVRDET